MWGRARTAPFAAINNDAHNDAVREISDEEGRKKSFMDLTVLVISAISVSSKRRSVNRSSIADGEFCVQRVAFAIVAAYIVPSRGGSTDG
jgi:hypothetical protein